MGKDNSEALNSVQVLHIKWEFYSLKSLIKDIEWEFFCHYVLHIKCKDKRACEYIIKGKCAILTTKFCDIGFYHHKVFVAHKSKSKLSLTSLVLVLKFIHFTKLICIFNYSKNFTVSTLSLLSQNFVVKVTHLFIVLKITPIFLID